MSMSLKFNFWLNTDNLQTSLLLTPPPNKMVALSRAMNAGILWIVPDVRVVFHKVFKAVLYIFLVFLSNDIAQVLSNWIEPIRGRFLEGRNMNSQSRPALILI